jgi:hypothetical protein
MTVRVHLLPLYDALAADPIDVPDGAWYETQATSGAGLIADVYRAENAGLLATFANVRFVEHIENPTPAQKLTELIRQVYDLTVSQAEGLKVTLDEQVAQYDSACRHLAYGKDWAYKPVTAG